MKVIFTLLTLISINSYAKDYFQATVTTKDKKGINARTCPNIKCKVAYGFKDGQKLELKESSKGWLLEKVTKLYVDKNFFLEIPKTKEQSYNAFEKNLIARIKYLIKKNEGFSPGPENISLIYNPNHLKINFNKIDYNIIHDSTFYSYHDNKKATCAFYDDSSKVIFDTKTMKIISSSGDIIPVYDNPESDGQIATYAIKNHSTHRYKFCLAPEIPELNFTDYRHHPNAFIFNNFIDGTHKFFWYKAKKNDENAIYSYNKEQQKRILKQLQLDQERQDQEQNKILKKLNISKKDFYIYKSPHNLTILRPKRKVSILGFEFDKNFDINLYHFNQLLKLHKKLPNLKPDQNIGLIKNYHELFLNKNNFSGSMPFMFYINFNNVEQKINDFITFTSPLNFFSDYNSIYGFCAPPESEQIYGKIKNLCYYSDLKSPEEHALEYDENNQDEKRYTDESIYYTFAFSNLFKMLDKLNLSVEDIEGITQNQGHLSFQIETNTAFTYKDIKYPEKSVISFYYDKIDYIKPGANVKVNNFKSKKNDSIYFDYNSNISFIKRNGTILKSFREIDFDYTYNKLGIKNYAFCKTGVNPIESQTSSSNPNYSVPKYKIGHCFFTNYDSTDISFIFKVVEFKDNLVTMVRIKPIEEDNSKKRRLISKNEEKIRLDIRELYTPYSTTIDKKVILLPGYFQVSDVDYKQTTNYTLSPCEYIYGLDNNLDDLLFFKYEDKNLDVLQSIKDNTLIKNSYSDCDAPTD